MYILRGKRLEILFEDGKPWRLDACLVWALLCTSIELEREKGSGSHGGEEN